jgi:hypothetical protein
MDGCEGSTAVRDGRLRGSLTAARELNGGEGSTAVRDRAQRLRELDRCEGSKAVRD